MREEFYSDVKVLGSEKNLNVSLEKAQRVADFLDHGELMARDALTREESCGGHYREEHSKMIDGAPVAVRDDENFSHVSAWFYEGKDKAPTRGQEDLEFEYVKLTQRSYK